MNSAWRPGIDAGFSLIELLVVLAIVAVVAGLFMPVMERRSDSTLLRATVQELREAVRVTRGTAIARNTETVLTIDVQNCSFGSPTTSVRLWVAEIVARATFAEPEQSRLAAVVFGFIPMDRLQGAMCSLRLEPQKHMFVSINLPERQKAVT